MDVVVAGGHGKIGLLLLERLVAAGHTALGLIRDPGQAADLEAVGARAVVCDMEAEPSLQGFLARADAVVFAAGAGSGSGPDRKRTVDYSAAVKLIDAALTVDARRYLMVSAIAAPAMAHEPGEMQPYFAAKAEADFQLERSGLDFTIVRPGTLTDDPATGAIDARLGIERGGAIPREDVADVLLRCLTLPNTFGRTFDLVSGDTPIDEALNAL